MILRTAATSLALCLFLSATAVAQSLQVAGIEIAEQVSLDGQKLLLNGSGVRKLFGFRVYVAALYLPSPARSASRVLERDQPRRLQITLLRDTSTEQNLDALKEGLIDNNSEAEMEALRPEVNRFFASIQQVQAVPAGTVILIDYLPGKGTQSRIGKQELGLIPGARFNRALLKIWLGDKPIQTSLKQALLSSDVPTL